MRIETKYKMNITAKEQSSKLKRRYRKFTQGTNHWAKLELSHHLRLSRIKKTKTRICHSRQLRTRASIVSRPLLKTQKMTKRNKRVLKTRKRCGLVRRQIKILLREAYWTLLRLLCPITVLWTNWNKKRNRLGLKLKEGVWRMKRW